MTQWLKRVYPIPYLIQIYNSFAFCLIIYSFDELEANLLIYVFIYIHLPQFACSLIVLQLLMG